MSTEDEIVDAVVEALDDEIGELPLDEAIAVVESIGAAVQARLDGLRLDARRFAEATEAAAAAATEGEPG